MGELPIIAFYQPFDKQHRNINVLTKPCLYDIGIQLLKFLNTLLKVGFLKTEVVNFC